MAIFQSLVRLGVAGNLSKYGRAINDARLCSAIVNRMNQCSYKSTAPPASTQTAPRDPLDLSFDCNIAAFKSKTFGDLLRAYFVFQICSFEVLVENNMKILAISRKLLGNRGFELLMDMTFFGHFVGGRDLKDCVKTLDR